MQRILRTEWLDWCDEVNSRVRHGLDLVDAHARFLEAFDYAPIDDILEIDLRSAIGRTRILIDHPSSIIAEADDEGHVIVVVDAPGVSVVLHESNRHSDQVPPQDVKMPDALRGAYFEG